MHDALEDRCRLHRERRSPRPASWAKEWEGRCAGGDTGRPDQLSAGLLRHDSDGLDEIGIVGKHQGDIKPILNGVPHEVARQIHVATFFFDFSNLHHFRAGKIPDIGIGARCWRLHQKRPLFPKEESAVVNFNFGDCGKCGKIHLLLRRRVSVNLRRNSSGIIFYPIYYMRRRDETVCELLQVQPPKLPLPLKS